MRSRVLSIAMWILLRLVPGREREPLAGDLTEEYLLRASAASSSAALKWYLQQLCASVPPLLWASLMRAAWVSTVGVAILAYVAVGVAELTVNWAISRSFTSGTVAYNALGLIFTSPMVLLIGYLAAGFRRAAAIVLAAMMVLVIAVLTLWTAESMPVWLRIAYFTVGPGAAFFGSALRRLQLQPGRCRAAALPPK